MDVGCDAYSEDAPIALHPLTGRLRVGVYHTEENPPRSYMRLRQAQLKTGVQPPRAQHKKVSLKALDKGANCDVKQSLAPFGGEVTTRGTLLTATGRGHDELLLAFPAREHGPALAAYVLTSVLPMLNADD